MTPLLRRLAAALLTASVTAGSLAVTAAPASADVPCGEGGPHYIDEPSWALARLAVGRAWRITTGKGVTVAVVDSGVAADNAHLRDAVKPGHSLVGGDPRGFTDVWGHGTGVAGLIAARPVEGSAAYGVAPSADILPVRVFVQDQLGGVAVPQSQLPDVGRMAEGIEWAARNGADVINVSMSTRTDDPRLRAAVREAVRRDVVVVASGGNRNSEDEKDGLRYPAALPGVVGVAASDSLDQVTPSSIHGGHIDVFAPGQNVLTSYKTGGDCLAGTDLPYSSYAAGYVSGLAALLRAKYPEESAEQIVYRLTASADRPLRGERDDAKGWGMVQPVEALTLTFDPNRPGPPVPGAAQAASAGGASGMPPIRPRTDPLAPLREEMLWWLLFGAGAIGLAFVLRPWVGPALRRRAAGPPEQAES